MIRIENDCVGCPACVECGRRHTAHYYCDSCDQEFDPDELYDMDGTMMCEDCVLESIPKIKEVYR